MEPMRFPETLLKSMGKRRLDRIKGRPQMAGRMGLVGILGGVILFLSGCRTAVPTIAVIPRTCGTLLWEAEHTGVQRAAATSGLYVYWNAPMREDDVQGQIEILTRALERGAKGLIVAPVEALPLRTSIHRALLAGTPVVVVGTDLGLLPGNTLAYVLNDERIGGQMAARRVGQLLKGQGTVAILGISNQLTSTAERARSLEATLAEESPKVHVVFRSLALPTVSQEQQVAEKLLAGTPHVDAIVALTEFSTRGTYYALTEFNKTSSTHLIGFDQNLLVPVRTGGIDSVIMQNTNQMGRAAMKLMEEELHGGATQKYVVLQPQLVSRANIDSNAVKEILDLSWFSK
jgi:ribose transport system substrate-binding protein